jgi:hypothetical protein
MTSKSICGHCGALKSEPVLDAKYKAEFSSNWVGKEKKETILKPPRSRLLRAFIRRKARSQILWFESIRPAIPVVDTIWRHKEKSSQLAIRLFGLEGPPRREARIIDFSTKSLRDSPFFV